MKKTAFPASRIHLDAKETTIIADIVNKAASGKNQNILKQNGSILQFQGLLTMNVVLKQSKTTLIKIMEEMFSSIEGETFEVNTKSGSVVFNEELGKLKECADWTQLSKQFQKLLELLVALDYDIAELGSFVKLANFHKDCTWASVQNINDNRMLKEVLGLDEYSKEIVREIKEASKSARASGPQQSFSRGQGVPRRRRSRHWPRNNYFDGHNDFHFARGGPVRGGGPGYNNRNRGGGARGGGGGGLGQSAG